MNSKNSRWVLGLAGLVVLGIVLGGAWFVAGPGESGDGAGADAARLAALASEHSPATGSADAPVHIVEFLDPACETCAMFYPLVKRWMKEVPGGIRLSVRHVPFHNGAEYAVRVLEAARAQDKYWEALEALLESQAVWTEHHVVKPEKVLPMVAGIGLDMDRLREDMNSPEVAWRMEQDKQDSVILKVSKTPEYYVNGRPLPSFGAQQLADLVREELSKAK